jgi:LysM repeat protein
MKIHSSRLINFSIRSISLLMAVIFSAILVVPGMAATDTNSDCVSYHTVQVSDNLRTIIRTHQLRWQDLIAANHLAAPDYRIYVGQNLCIPKSKKNFSVPSGSAFKSKPANYAVVRTGNNLSIYTVNFPKNNVFYVKADDSKVSGLNWYKVGTIRTGSKTANKYTFKLPSQLVKSSFFTVCVKNATTDAVACRNLVAGP